MDVAMESGSTTNATTSGTGMRKHTDTKRCRGGKSVHEGGFVTLFVLVLAMLVFFALTLGLETSYGLERQNRRLARDLQERADQLTAPDSRNRPDR